MVYFFIFGQQTECDVIMISCNAIVSSLLVKVVAFLVLSHILHNIKMTGMCTLFMLSKALSASSLTFCVSHSS